ncbi:hypothetical protein ACVGVM_29770 (plasmid) [Pseudonocardia bannensis]|uniref:Uncharacterized protein n=1 Tax=Pseudonocardia bannensis TaxID=630973 RepID=A0A848DPU2_9PSEU|nr:MULTISPECIES: hypothetical protein [Pseudonocardia]NMH94555.1 hypothetical protein [Pseudonocardia bannensis]
MVDVMQMPARSTGVEPGGQVEPFTAQPLDVQRVLDALYGDDEDDDDA